MASMQEFGTQASMKNQLKPAPEMAIHQWVAEPHFYLVAGIYTATRVYFCISQSYITFYVQYTLAMSKDYAAIIPLVMFVTGLIVSGFMKVVIKTVGLKVAFILSSMVGLGIIILLNE